MQGLQQRLMYESSRMPLVIEAARSGGSLADSIQTNRDLLDARLLEHGALLFRGFGVTDVTQFESVVNAISPQRLDYMYRSTPRTAVGDRIFTASEYPADQEIPLHNENAYQRDWPLKLAFCCVHPAVAGGQTPIADTRQVTGAIGPELLEKFASRGVKYVRHYRPGTDLSWQTVFQTDERRAVEQFCSVRDIGYEWLDEETLRTYQVCPADARHPITGERVFFNQAHLFHVSSMGEEAAQALLDVFGADRLPRHACYGDGAEFTAEELQAVRTAYGRAALSFNWHKGDVLLLDNVQAAHGRRPFAGRRRVLTSLMDGREHGEGVAAR